MTKTEQLAREIMIALNKGQDPFLVGSSVEDDSPLAVVGEPLDVILDLIIEFLGQLFALWNENCADGPFANRVRTAGPFQQMRARLQWSRMERNAGIDTGLSSREVVRTSQSVALTKQDTWLNEAAAEITKPNWMF